MIVQRDALNVTANTASERQPGGDGDSPKKLGARYGSRPSGERQRDSSTLDSWLSPGRTPGSLYPLAPTHALSAPCGRGRATRGNGPCGTALVARPKGSAAAAGLDVSPPTASEGAGVALAERLRSLRPRKPGTG